MGTVDGDVVGEEGLIVGFRLGSDLFLGSISQGVTPTCNPQATVVASDV